MTSNSSNSKNVPPKRPSFSRSTCVSIGRFLAFSSGVSPQTSTVRPLHRQLSTQVAFQQPHERASARLPPQGVVRAECFPQSAIQLRIIILEDSITWLHILPVNFATAKSIQTTSDSAASVVLIPSRPKDGMIQPPCWVHLHQLTCIQWKVHHPSNWGSQSDLGTLGINTTNPQLVPR